MIYTLTLNPAIDKTVKVDRFQIGTLNRIRDSRKDASGKGINVSKVVHSLGGNSMALGFLGGENGLFIKKKLKERGIKTNFITIKGETRMNIKVFDKFTKKITELNESGPLIREKELETLKRILKDLIQNDDLLVISGSTPRNLAPDIYRNLMDLLPKDVKVLVDTDGKLLEESIKSKPYLIKPNIFELERVIGKELNNTEDIKKGIKKVLKNGSKAVLLTMGSKGAYYVEKDTAYFIGTLDINVKSTTGAGDAMLGGFVYALSKNLPLLRILKKAAACAAASIALEGTQPGNKSLVDKIESKIQLRKIKL